MSVTIASSGIDHRYGLADDDDFIFHKDKRGHIGLSCLLYIRFEFIRKNISARRLNEIDYIMNAYAAPIAHNGS